jgi:dTDP-4-dehydrorhamnose 3,5-epimerase
LKIISVQPFTFPEIQIIRFARFCDHRGYFSEHFRKSDFRDHPLLGFMKNVEFLQTNESFSKTGTIRGLHLQWNPYMGKMVRTVQGHMIDLILDIRKGSPNFGKIIAYDMPSNRGQEHNEWIWIPPGFAHGNFFREDSQIEYFCSGEYSPGCEAGISPLARDIDWSLCDPHLRKQFQQMAQVPVLITDKDKNGLSVAAWEKDERSNHFILGKMGL